MRMIFFLSVLSTLLLTGCYNKKNSVEAESTTHQQKEEMEGEHDLKEYNGKVQEGSMEVDFGEGVIITTDRGTIELMYHNDDEMGEGSSTNYTVTYLLKDGAGMSKQ